MSADIKLSKAKIKKKNSIRMCFRIHFRKTSWSIIKDCYSISNKIFTSFSVTCCNEWYWWSNSKKTKKQQGSGTTNLVISNEEMNDIMKIVQALENSNILLIGVTKTIKNEIKKQDGKGIGMLLGTLGASLLGNLLTGKGIYRSGEGMYRAGQGIKKKY